MPDQNSDFSLDEQESGNKDLSAFEHNITRRLSEEVENVTADPAMLDQVVNKRRGSWRQGRGRLVGASMAATVLLVVSVVVISSSQDQPEVALNQDQPAVTLDQDQSEVAQSVFASAVLWAKSDGSCLSLVVWLEPEATDGQVSSIGDELDARFKGPSRYINRQKTWEEFQEFFADDPEVPSLVSPDDLPTRYEITWDEQDQPMDSDERARWQEMAAVQDLQTEAEGEKICR